MGKRTRRICYRFEACLLVATALACGQPSSNSAPDATVDAVSDDVAVVVDASDDDAESGPTVDQRVLALLAQMTLDEKLGQMTLVGYTFLTSNDDVTSDALGGLLAGGGDAPLGNMPSDWLALTNQYRALAAKTRLAIPLLFGIDAVHGNAKVIGTTVFPHDIGLGCANDTTLLRQIESITAAETLAMGINWVYSPELDVGLDERWGRTYESFGEDPALVSPLATAAVVGYQTTSLGSPGSILACAKHALGAGGTTWGTGVNNRIDQGDTQVDEATMRNVHLPPFTAAINAGVMSIMVSYSSWNGAKMSGSTMWLTNVLKGELGFRGFLVSDWGAVDQLPGTESTQIATAINAGLDMIMVPQYYASFLTTLKALVTANTITTARIDDAVTRILHAKFTAGLFDNAPPDSSGLSSVGSAANRAVARSSVSKSLVLLQNNGALPLNKSAHIHVAGAAASDFGIQSGGWTLGWQGKAGLNLGGGETILQGLQDIAGKNGGTVTYSADGTNTMGATVGVVVLHELPYAEYMGDVTNPSFTDTSDANVYDGSEAAVVANMKAANIPLVMVLVSGRPIRIESLLSSFNAIVAAWLPGSEGEGVADVLYGDVPFSGKLSKSWPKDATVLPIHHDQTLYDPLFAYGFGL